MPVGLNRSWTRGCSESVSMLEEIEHAVLRVSSKELAAFRAAFAEFDAAREPRGTSKSLACRGGGRETIEVPLSCRSARGQS